MTTTPRTYEPLSVEQLQALHANLNPERVAKRQGGGGRQLSYLEAYDIKATLIRVFGYGGFSADVIDAQIVQIIPGGGENDKYVTVLAKATVRITIHQTGATYTETAAASQSGSQGIGEVADFAIKTAESDALKRAAIYLGTQFGLSLYDNGAVRDVVRRVVSPDQAEITRDLVTARQEGTTGDPNVDAAAVAARQRLQARLKVHKPAPDAEPEPTEPTEPTEPAAEKPEEKAPEPAQAAEKPKAAPRARKAPTAREKAARAALADAEATVGLKTKDRPNFPPDSAFNEQDGEARDPAADGASR